ncbi:hypothetical protein PSACC_01125 [Paramicrosporidium saccamoebae]|uniref:RRM domain-containing protein n=1 Tax=Paramicrosporidium saccamoebae TaxID=1246581 RepID=A0A2H9TMW4_9FUNG|nr:hypothetical protein PSACC_01125 [Paramicrosporidium saccamoebae]
MTNQHSDLTSLSTPDRKKRKTDESRTIYLGGVPPTITATALLNHIRGGAILSLRFLTERSCAFVDFVDAKGAASFYGRGRRMCVGGVEVRVGWAKTSAVSQNVETAIRNGASRNVFIGNLDIDEGATPEEEEQLSAELKAQVERFGLVEHIKVVPERHCAFVHLTSVADAMKAVSVMSGEEQWQGKRLGFGRDRCSNEPSKAKNRENEKEEGQLDTVQEEAPKRPEAPLRTIYLGRMPPETTAEDLCNIIRGGALEKIRVTPEKQCAFVTFLEPMAAQSFFDFATQAGIWIRGNRLKPGWGQASSLPAAVTVALRQGATRNVYLGNINLSNLTEDDLRRSFSAYGPIEMINFLRKERDVVFVNFCQLLDAVKAVEGVRKDPLFQNCNISYGRDRCAQPLRTIPEPREFVPVSDHYYHPSMLRGVLPRYPPHYPAMTHPPLYPLQYHPPSANPYHPSPSYSPPSHPYPYPYPYHSYPYPPPDPYDPTFPTYHHPSYRPH